MPFVVYVRIVPILIWLIWVRFSSFMQLKGNAEGVDLNLYLSKKKKGKKAGHVVIIDLANTEKSAIEIMAHEAAVSCMVLSNEGAKIATSSIKVFVFGAKFIQHNIE